MLRLLRTKRLATATVAIGCLLVACSSQPESSAPVGEITVQATDEQDAFTEQLARVYSWADQLEVAASVSDLAARETVLHPVYMLRRDFDQARRMTSRLANTPVSLPGAATAATERLDRMNGFLNEIAGHISTAEALTKRTPIDGHALEGEAHAIKVAVEMAATEHAGLLEFVSDPRFNFVDFSVVRPRHQLAINYAAMISQTHNMLLATDTSADWTVRWDRGSEQLLRSLESARDALKEVAPESEPQFAELWVQDRLIGEGLFSLRAELAKPSPDQTLARQELQGVSDALVKAQAVYRGLVEANDAIAYPEYDFDRTEAETHGPR